MMNTLKQWGVVMAAAAMMSSVTALGGGTIVLVDPTTNNGSFETGALAPWVSSGSPGLFGAGVTNNVTPGPQSGTRYAYIDGGYDGGDRHSILTETVDGLALNPGMFKLNFYTRKRADTSSSGVYVNLEMRVQDPGGSWLSYLPSVQGIQTITDASLSNSQWNAYTYLFSFTGIPANNGVMGIRLSLDYKQLRPSSGAHGWGEAYLDSVFLEIPEPATAATFLLGLSAAGLVLRRRR